MKYRALSENHLYLKTYAKGERQVTGTVALYVLRDYKAGALARSHPMKKKQNRIGITVSKKIGGAVTRNRVKRTIREAYRLIDKENEVRTGYLVVIVARDGAVGKKMQDVKRDLFYALRKKNMLINI